MIPCTTQFLMARTGLDLSLDAVAERTGLSCESLRDLEEGIAGLRPSDMAALIRFYESNGVEFGPDFVRSKDRT